MRLSLTFWCALGVAYGSHLLYICSRKFDFGIAPSVWTCLKVSLEFWRWRFKRHERVFERNTRRVLRQSTCTAVDFGWTEQQLLIALAYCILLHFTWLNHNYIINCIVDLNQTNELFSPKSNTYPNSEVSIVNTGTVYDILGMPGMRFTAASCSW